MTREDYEKGFHDCCAVVFTLVLGCELLFEQKANKDTKTNSILMAVKQGKT